MAQVGRCSIAVLWCLLAWALAGCGERPGVPIDRMTLGERSVELPGRVDEWVVPGEDYRLEAAVELPPSMRGRAVDLSIPLLEARVQVHADGLEVLALEEAPGYRAPGAQRFRISESATEDGRLELALTVEHRWAKSAWLPTVPHLVPAGAVDPPAEAAQWLNVRAAWLAMAVLLQVGATCVLVYLLDRRRRPYLWFGIQAVFAMGYPAFSSGMLTGLLGPWDVLVVELSLVLALLVSLRFTHSLFGLGPIPRVLDGLLVLAGGASLVLVDPFSSVTIAARSVVIVVTTCIVYQLVIIARAVARDPRQRGEAMLLGAAWVALAAGTWDDLFGWFTATELLGGPRPACLGLTVFALFLSLVLSRSHITTLGRADELNVELTDRMAEIDAERARVLALNEELRTQVAERSANLFAALALVESEEGRRERLVEGTEIDGRYRIEGVLGSGAMGMVYEVTLLTDDSRWAMKVANDVRGVALARLAREAHVASQLQHDHVVQIRDIGASTLGFMYIVLELVEGRNLGERLRQEGPLPVDAARRVLAQVASGLAALHGVGIAHRDLKPDNVLLTERDGEPWAKITDFGISRVGEDMQLPPAKRPAPPPEAPPSDIRTVSLEYDHDASATASASVGRRLVEAEAAIAGMVFPSEMEVPTRALPGREGSSSRSSGAGTPSNLALTGTGFLVGTPHYIAPELARSGPRVDVRADLFSFGVLAFELLTGSRPFEEAIVVRVLRGEEVDDEVIPPLPEELAGVGEVLVRCLSFDPAQRPTAQEVAEALGETNG